MVFARQFSFLSAWLWLLLVGGLGGCVSRLPEPRSKVVLERSWGTAGGQSEEEALRLVEMIETVLPIYRALDGFVELPVRAHIIGGLRPDHLVGIKVEPLVGPSWLAITRGRDGMELSLAHELAHLYFEADQARFPAVIEEGICELLSGLAFDASRLIRMRLIFTGAAYLNDFRLIVEDEVQRKEVYSMAERMRKSAPTLEEALSLDRARLLRAGEARTLTCYGLGLLLVKRIGWHGIQILLRRADRAGHEQVPIAWILAAAGIEEPFEAGLREVLEIEIRTLGSEDGCAPTEVPAQAR